MHNDFDPDKIEDLLRNAPKIEDTRSKADVFARLKADGAFDEIVSQSNNEFVKPVNNVKRSLPFFKVASFVALFAVVIIVSALVNNIGDSSLNSTNDSREMKSSDKAERGDYTDIEEDSFGVQSEKSQTHNITMVGMGDYRTGLYADELVNDIVFTIGLAGNAAESVPVSMKIPTSFLNENGLSSDASYLQIYELVAPLLDEEALGFSEYHPFVGRFEEQGNRLIHYLPNNHSYDLASATISNYIGALKDTFGAHYKEVLLRNENGEPIGFSEVGKMNEPIVLKEAENGMNFFVFEQDNGMLYLSPNFRTGYKTLTDAFATLKDEWNDVYKTAMIDEIEFELEDRETYTAVKFMKPLDVTLYEVNELMYMLEAIIATAASFGQQVKFENIMQEEWGGFQFTEVIPQLMGINEIDFPF